jgi:predicted 2-oxoglutarate/Fe(II)-dependent dioxygenase YbiX
MMLRRLPLGTTHIVLQRDFLDAAACADLRRAIAAGRSTPAEIYDEGYRVDPAVRRTFDVDVTASVVSRVEQLFAAARDGIGDAFGVTLRGAEGPGFLRYPAGGFYRAHQDALGDADGRFPRLLSVVLFLTGSTDVMTPVALADACIGGALRLHDSSGFASEPVDVAPARGMLVVFPSHLVHEVLPVTAGVRDVIVDWFY